MTAANASRVLLCGDFAAAELAPAIAWLRARCRCDASPVPRSPRNEYQAIVLCQSRPGTLSREIVHDLHRTHPLSRLIALLGPWCEGEVRSGKPWPGVARIYWHQWPARLPREIGPAESASGDPLPRTATEVDLLVSRPAPPRARQPGLVGVVTGQQIDFEAIALALATGGHHGVWILAGRGAPVLEVDALVIDGEDPAPCESFGFPPAVMLADFPGPGITAAAQQPLRCEVLAKPYLVADLLDRVNSLLAASAAAAPSRTCAA